MAKERTTISGYIVSLEAFVPCDPRQPQGMVDALESIAAASAAFATALPADAEVTTSPPDWRERRRPQPELDVTIPPAPSEAALS